MPNMNNIIGPDGCDLDYKGSDFEPREDDEFITLEDRKAIKNRIDKAVKGFWDGVDNAKSE